MLLRRLAVSAYGALSLSLISQSAVALDPLLTISEHNICAELLEKVKETRFETRRNHFDRQAGFKGILEPTGISYSPGLEVDGQLVAINPRTNPGCGGACETYSLEAKSVSFNEQPGVRTMGAEQQSILVRSGNGEYFGLSETPRFLRLEKLEKSAKWSTACNIEFYPQSIDLVNGAPERLKVALSELQSVRHLVAGNARGHMCGSMQTDARWATRFDNYFPLLLTRPWAMEEQHGGYYHREIKHDLEGFKRWSLRGINNYAQYHRLFDLRETVLSELATFYQTQYQLSQQESEDLALRALDFVFDISFRFSGYNDFVHGEEALREAILSGAGMSALEAIEVDFDSYKEKMNKSYFGENLLTIAVGNAHATKFLLGQGLRADRENGFGKTPLMYAAQYDDAQSVRFLLEKGASVHAETYIPRDKCNYQLKTSGYTALHYAARYASKEVIDVLLEAGSSPYKRTDAVSPEGYEKYAIDWLEENKNLSDTDVSQLKIALKLPDDITIARKMSKRLNRQAEMSYSKGDVLSAYQDLNLAIQLNKSNLKALSNLSLVGLRAGKHREALAASVAVIRSSASDKVKASAYFNAALTIQDFFEKNGEKRVRSLEITEGDFDEKAIYEGFLFSAVLAPRQDRESEFIRWFKEHLNVSCTGIPGIYGRSGYPVLNGLDGSRRRYERGVDFLTEGDVKVERLCWIAQYRSGRKHHCAKVSEQHTIGKYTLNRFVDADLSSYSGAIEIDGQRCDAP